MVAPSIKVPNVTNSDESGLVPTPGTLEFNSDLNAMRYFDNSGVPQTFSAGGGGTGTQNIVWVGVNGVDAPGNGTFALPYASLTYALSQITTAAFNNPFTIQMGTGFYNENTISLKPFINIAGNQANLSLFGFLQLDSSFDSVVNPFLYIQDLTIQASAIQMQCNVFQNAKVHFYNCDLTNTGSIFFTGAGTSNLSELFIIEKSTSLTGLPSLQSTNCSLGIVSSNGTALNVINNSATTNSFFYYQENIGFTGALSLQNSSTGSITSYITSSANSGGGLSIDGTGITVNIDSASYGFIPSFSSGATISQINLMSLADGVNQTSYTPVNYTPIGSSNYSSTSLTANLAGIDAALASLSPGTPIEQQLWVNATDGNDANSGDIDSPLQTYNAALSIAAANAGFGNIYLINVIGDQSITGDFVIGANVTVDGHDSGTITATGDLIIDPTVISSSNLLATVKNCAFNLNSINLTFGSGSNNIVELLNCTFPSVPSITVTSPNTNTNPSGLVIYGRPEALTTYFGGGVTITDAQVEFVNISMITNISVSATGTIAPTSLVLESVDGSNTITAASPLGAICDVELLRSASQNVTLSDVNCSVFTDVLSLNSHNLTLSGGATSAQVTYLTDCSAQGVTSLLYVPTSYTPSSPSPKVRSDSILSHLNGINSALGSIPSGSMNTNKVLGRYSAGTGPAQELSLPFGISITPIGDLIWNYNYGAVSPGTLVANANVSSVTQTGSFYFEQTGSISGAIVNGTIQFTFTSTSTLPSIQVPYPVLPGGLSVSAVNVVGNVRNSSVPTVADGYVLNSTANTTYFTVEMITAAAATYVCTVYFQYRLV